MMSTRIGRAMLALMLLVTSTLLHAESRLLILCYHEVQQAQELQDSQSVDVSSLVRQLEWLKGQGFSFVSSSQILAARAGGAALPEKSVLLTFDDGYRSVYTQVYPVLKLFHAPALIALVGSWLTPPENAMVNFAGVSVARNKFLSWEQIREMQASGLVEVGNHTYQQHYGLQANPQGNLLPAASSQRYDPATGRYESHANFLQRLRDDLARNNAVLQAQLGQAPKMMVWPYGSYTQEAASIAAQLGMPATLTLDDGINLASTPLSGLRRVLVGADMELADFALLVNDSQRWPQGIRPRPSRVMYVDLDDVYDPDPQQQEQKLGLMLDRVRAMGPTTVYLQAFSDPENSGSAQALYFPNRHLPLRADLFSRAAWQLRTRAGVNVFAYLPVLSFRLPQADARALALQPGSGRLSPFSDVARQTIREIYQDLGRAGHFGGLLLGADATLSDDADASPAALAAYRQWGLPGSLAEIRGNDAMLAQWTRDKNAWLETFRQQLIAEVRVSQPTLQAALTLPAAALLYPDEANGLAQLWPAVLHAYDYVAVEAQPEHPGTGSASWLHQLFSQVAATPGALQQVVFELPSLDWRAQQPLPAALLAGWVRQINTWGARNIAYYPDDFNRNQPPLQALRRVFSMNEVPE